MTDIAPDTLPAPTKDDLLRDSDFVSRWNAGDPAAIRQLDAVSQAAVAGAPLGDKPRPPGAGTGLLTPDQARQLAQASVDAGQDPAAIKAALADTDPDWTPDTRDKAARVWADDHEPGHPERYRIDGLDRHFEGALPQEREAFADVVRGFVATVGLDRGPGSDMAETIVKTAAQFHGQRPDALAQYRHEQRARLGAKADELVAEASRALANANPDVVALLHKSGALDNADVIAQLAFMAQARAVRQ